MQFPFLSCLGNQINCFEKSLKTEVFTTENFFLVFKAIISKYLDRAELTNLASSSKPL